LAAIAVAGLGLAACSSSNSGGGEASVNPGPSNQELIIAMINPFSGQDAAFGLDMNAGCVAAVQVINAHVGALGHTFKCAH
jgi:ABC-type branched-subunit amino acid transport system substrate-binding protein